MTILMRDPSFRYKFSGIPLALIAAKAGERDTAVKILLGMGPLRSAAWSMWLDRIPPLREVLRDPRLKPLTDELGLLRSSTRSSRELVRASQ